MSLSWIHLLAFIVAICLLVTVHEFGHYWVARRLGFKVLRFSVGFGKALWSRTAGADGTEYVIAMVPLGGYVKMLDEREGPVASAELHRAFTRRPHWQRITVLLAGPAFNVLFAVLLLTGILLVSGITEVRPLLGDIDPTAIAGRAGLHAGDEIVSIAAHPVASQRDALMDLLDAVSASSPITIGVRGSDGAQRTTVLPITDPTVRHRLTEPSALISGLGLRFYEPTIPAVLGAVEPGGPAARAGLKAGDAILSVNGTAVHDFLELVARIQAHAGESVAIRYRRADVEAAVRVPVLAETQDGRTVGRIRVRQPPPPPYAAAHATVAAGSFRACECRGLGHDGAAGTAALAHAHRAGIDQESQRPAQHRRVCGRLRRAWSELLPVFSRRGQPGARVHEPAAHSDPRWRPDPVPDHRMAQRQSAV